MSTHLWIDVNDRLPDLKRFISGRGWSEKTYVLGVDSKGRMGVGFFTEQSYGPRWTSARAMGDATHWMLLPTAPVPPGVTAGEK